MVTHSNVTPFTAMNRRRRKKIIETVGSHVRMLSVLKKSSISKEFPCKPGHVIDPLITPNIQRKKFTAQIGKIFIPA